MLSPKGAQSALTEEFSTKTPKTQNPTKGFGADILNMLFLL
jgi:hypothetical protein